MKLLGTIWSNKCCDTDQNISNHYISPQYTVKPVCNDHLYDKINYLWFIQ